MKPGQIVILCLSLLYAGTAFSGTFTSTTTPGSTPEFEGITLDKHINATFGAILDDWTTTTGAPMLASPKLADLTGDSVDEILMTTYGISSPYGEGWLHAWDGQGNELINYPIHLTGAAPGTPAIGDLDNDGDAEIVQGTWNFLYVFNADGTNFPGWPISLYVTQAAALADLDDDGDLEIIVPTSSSMMVYHHDGTAFPGFPVYGANSLTAAAVGDLDDDGDLEIVSGSFVASGSPSDFVYAWHHDGTPVTGFPVTTSGSVKAPPALADLDGDGTLEVIADCWVQAGTDFLYVWDHLGNPEPGWPLNIPYIRLSSPSVADLDLDGDLEIIVGGWSTAPYGEEIHAHHHDGSTVTGFPVILNNSPSGNVNNTPTVGNIDDDDHPEIVVKAVNNIFALNHDGSIVSGFPVFLDDENHSGTTSPTPALGDPDGDGLVEIFAASCYNNVMLIDQTAVYSTAGMYWPTFRFDSYNRGTYVPESAFPNVTLTLTPYNPPIQIPASGGSFDFNIAVANNEAAAVSFDVWCDVTLPNGSPYGPVIGPVSLTFSGGFGLNRDRSQDVPANAPAGTYTYNGYVGEYPSTIWDQDNFDFLKLSTGDGPWVDGWSNSGESLNLWMPIAGEVVLPEVYAVGKNYPNPFNAVTIIPLELPQRSNVKIELFNIMGQNLGVIYEGVRDAGWANVRYDAKTLSSGVYFYYITAEGLERGGKFQDVGKMLLLK